MSWDTESSPKVRSREPASALRRARSSSLPVCALAPRTATSLGSGTFDAPRVVGSFDSRRGPPRERFRGRLHVLDTESSPKSVIAESPATAPWSSLPASVRCARFVPPPRPARAAVVRPGAPQSVRGRSRLDRVPRKCARGPKDEMFLEFTRPRAASSSLPTSSRPLRRRVVGSFDSRRGPPRERFPGVTRSRGHGVSSS